MTSLSRRSLLLAALALGGCGSVYTPDYLMRTLTRRDANTNDYLWKASVGISASTSQQPIAIAADRDARALNVFSGALGGEDIDRFMERTNTNSLMILHNGQVVLQRYATGVGPDSPQAVFSVSKSVLSLLVGRMLAAEKLGGVDDPITRYIPELRDRDPRFDRITIGHLLDMRSGIAFSDDLSFPFVTNDAPLVYYASDLREVVMKKTRIAADPGTFTYNDYNPNLVALAFERSLGAEGLAAARDALWNDLGTEDSAQWSIDKKGFAYWESGLVASPRDLAKIGLLVLRTESEASPLLSASWRSRIVTAPTPTDISEFNGKQWAYRAGWWLMLRPDGRHDVAAIGRFSQIIYVSPSNGVVIVRTGGDRHPPEDGDLTSLFFAVASALGAVG